MSLASCPLMLNMFSYNCIG